MKKWTLIALVVVLASVGTIPLVWANGTGLVSYWPFEEGSGSTAHDAVNDNDGTIYSASYVDGRFGQALQFNGTDAYVEVSDDPSLDITGDLTLSAWIKVDGFIPSEGHHMYVVGKDTSGSGNRSYGIGVDLTWSRPKKPFLIVFHSDGSYLVAWGSEQLEQGIWYHLAGVYDAASDTAKLYVDGVGSPASGTISSIQAGNANLRIGGRQYPGHRCFFNGVIDEVGIWNRALTADEIAYLASPVVEIDIKPGSDPNCFNVDGHGVIPVAILGSDSLDVTQIDVSTVQFQGLDVRVRGNDAPQCSVEDVSGDGLADLVCQFVDDPGTWQPDTGTATLTGRLLDGMPFEGTDEICIRPAETKSASASPDINSDGATDILDLVMVAAQFGSLAPNPAAADVNGDGVVDILDIVLIGANFS